jgi:hypothetical protein
VTGGDGGDAATAEIRRKTILLPWADERLRELVAGECPAPADVVAETTARLTDRDAAVLVVESASADVRRTALRLLADRCTYVLLVRRDVWSGDGGQELLREVQRHPRRKLIRFWRDRAELERTLRDEVFTLDDSILVSQTVPDGAEVKVGSTFEQTWELENIGFRTWSDRSLAEYSPGCLEPEATRIPLPHTVPGQRVRLTATFAAPAAPSTCRSVWKLVEPDGALALPWAHGIWCEVRVVP